MSATTNRIDTDAVKRNPPLLRALCRNVLLLLLLLLSSVLWWLAGILGLRLTILRLAVGSLSVLRRLLLRLLRLLGRRGLEERRVSLFRHGGDEGKKERKMEGRKEGKGEVEGKLLKL